MAESELSEKDKEMLNAVAGSLSGRKYPPPTPPAATVEPQVPGKEVKPAQLQPGAGQVAPQEPPKPIEVSTAFGTQKFGGEGAPVLSSFEDVQAFAKGRGVELKSMDDIRGLFTAVESLTKQAETVPTLEAALSNYKSTLEGLPPEVTNILDAAINGGDYRSIVNNIAAGSGIDLSKPYSDHNQLDMIRRYVDPSVTKDTFEELTPIQKDGFDTLAKAKYGSDQVDWKQATKSNTDSKAKFQQDFTRSVDESIKGLMAAFPGMSQEHVKTVYDKMAYGTFKDSLFNQDNTYKPEAAIKIAMQEYGQESIQTQNETIGQMAEAARGKITGQVHEQLLRRSDTPDQKGRQVADQTNVVSDTVASELGFIKKR